MAKLASISNASDDLTSVVDPEKISAGCSGYVECCVDTPAIEKALAVSSARACKICPDDLAQIVDAAHLATDRARDVKGVVNASAVEEALAAATVRNVPHKLPGVPVKYVPVAPGKLYVV